MKDDTRQTHDLATRSMRTVTIQGGTVRARDLTMHLERGNQWIDVNRLFDRMGSETFDPTEATEVEHDGNLLELQEGDRLTVVVEMAE